MWDSIVSVTDHCFFAYFMPPRFFCHFVYMCIESITDKCWSGERTHEVLYENWFPTLSNLLGCLEFACHLLHCWLPLLPILYLLINVQGNVTSSIYVIKKFKNKVGFRFNFDRGLGISAARMYRIYKMINKRFYLHLAKSNLFRKRNRCLQDERSIFFTCK